MLACQGTAFDPLFQWQDGICWPVLVFSRHGWNIDEGWGSFSTVVKLVTSHFTLSPSLDTACPILGHSLATVSERQWEKRHFPSAVKLEQLIMAECSTCVCVRDMYPTFHCVRRWQREGRFPQVHTCFVFLFVFSRWINDQWVGSAHSVTQTALRWIVKTPLGGADDSVQRFLNKPWLQKLINNAESYCNAYSQVVQQMDLTFIKFSQT